ncbi:MAG: PetM family of cytochrome b6f complex subunit 7 [Hyphomicrobiales bacterium]|nr:PetM family of cytochrome b6f complex subunit 7 [Hyphomicrobiales bacterium]
MIRALLRGLGYLGLALGFIAFVDDGARYIANSEWSFLTIGSALDAVMPRAYAGWQTAAKLKLPGLLGDPVLTRTLATPFFVAATVIGVLLLFLGRKPKPMIGYSNRD